MSASARTLARKREHSDGFFVRMNGAVSLGFVPGANRDVRNTLLRKLIWPTVQYMYRITPGVALLQRKKGKRSCKFFFGALQRPGQRCLLFSWAALPMVGIKAWLGKYLLATALQRLYCAMPI